MTSEVRNETSEADIGMISGFFSRGGSETCRGGPENHHFLKMVISGRSVLETGRGGPENDHFQSKCT